MPALFLTVLVDLVGFAVILPVMPFFALHFDASTQTVTLLLASFSAMQFFAAPLWGRLSDRFGRRPTLLLTLIGSAAAHLGFAFAGSLTTLFIARAAAGLMAGNVAIAQSYIGDVTPPEERGKAMGLLGSAFGIGFVLGPALGGVLAGSDPNHPDFRMPALAAASLSAIAAVVCFAFLKESLPHSLRRRRGADAPATLRFSALMVSYLKNPTTAPLILLSFLVVTLFSQVMSIFPLWAEATLSWGPREISLVYVVLGVALVLVQAGVIGPLEKAAGARAVLAIGVAALAAGMIGLATIDAIWMVYVAMFSMSAGLGLVSPMISALISKATAPEHQGSVMGLSGSAQSLGRIAGPIWAGFAFTAFGPDSPFLIGGILMTVVWLRIVTGGLKRR